METTATEKPRVTLVRGDSLNPWEGQLWEGIMADFDVRAICTKKNLYPIHTLEYPVTQLSSFSDYTALRKIHYLLTTKEQQLIGLQSQLLHSDIVHTAEISYAYSYDAVMAKKKNPKLRVVVTVWDNSFGRYDVAGLGNRWRQKAKKRMMTVINGADFFLPVSKLSAAMLRSYGVPEEKMQVLMPAVVSAKQPVKVNIPSSLETVDLSNSILMVNRLVYEKGIYDVLYAWKLLQVRGKDVPPLVVVGQGPEKKRFTSLVHSLGLQKYIHVVGGLPHVEVKHLMSKVRALVLASLPTPTWQEQFGYVLAETMMQKKPVITTNTGAIPEVVGEGGIIVAPGNPDEIAHAVTTVFDDEVYANLVAKATKRGAYFQPKRFYTDLSEVYTALIKRGI